MRVLVPDIVPRVTLVGLSVEVRPVGCEELRVTVPVNPFRGATVTVEVTDVPGDAEPTLVGLSVTVNVVGVLSK